MVSELTKPSMALITLATARPHVLVADVERRADRGARSAKLALDAGVVERQVRVSEQQGRCWPRSSRRPSPIWNSVRRNGRAAVSWRPVTLVLPA